MTHRLRSALGMLAAFVCATALGCGREADEAPVVAPPVVLSPVSQVDLEEHLEASGELLARDRAQIAAEVAGRITRIVFDEGQSVAVGDVILEIDPERRELELASARAQHAEAQASLRVAQREHGRVTTLHERQVAADARLDETRSALERARAQVGAASAQAQIAERALRDSSVRAPFAGQIARRHVGRGEFVAVGTPLVDLVSLDPIEVEFHVAERDSARVALGQQVMVSVDPYPDELFRATVTVISPAIDPTTRTLRVLARVANSDGRLRPGLFARADLGVALREDVLMVPEEAVLQRADGPILYRLGPEDRVERVAADLGVHREGMVEVRSGLRPTDRVATRGHAGLVEGTQVSPRNPDGTPISGSLADANAQVGRAVTP